MMNRRLPAFLGFALVCGCSYHAQERADENLSAVVAHAFDLAPVTEPVETAPSPKPLSKPAGAQVPAVATDVQTTNFMQAEKEKPAEIMSRLQIPGSVPGSETERIGLPKDPAERRAAIKKLYPPLPPLPEGPKPLPGPDGHPYTLSQLQQIAAANSPALREAAANVEQARGNFIQAGTYPNPNVGWSIQPSNDGSTPGLQGPFIDQVVQTSGKLKLAAAAAEKDLQNAELALKRARSDLSTQVRNAYFAVLVAKETVRVNVGLSRFTDQVYLIQEELLENGFAAPYEPAALRAQAWTNRLALKQAIDTYIYSWKQLVAAAGLRQLPLSEVAGRIDRAIPFYDYDTVLTHVLRNHTDVLTAFNGVDKARYLLKAAQVTPIPNVEFNIAILKEYVLAPKQIVPTATISFPLPIWDQNKGNIIAAEAALMTASEEPHRVELTLTNNLATAYLSYRTNLEGLEYYRKFILPDQVRTYRGVFERRQIDINSAFGDLVQAQQTLASNVQTYLGILGNMWTAVVSVADLLQTDDLFQLGAPHELPELPDLDQLPPWLCTHPCNAQSCVIGGHGPVAVVVPTAPPTVGQALPAVNPFQFSPAQAQRPAPSILPEPVPISAPEVPVGPAVRTGSPNP
jgi:cobalt-zinc-cadmium efflux system outer membrane protein